MENLCRFCGNKTGRQFTNIFEDGTDAADGPNLLDKINSCIPITLIEDDKLPKRLCMRCVDRTNSVYDFIQTVRKTQKTFAGIQAKSTDDDSNDGRRQTRGSSKAIPPFECVTIAEKFDDSGTRATNTHQAVRSQSSRAKLLTEDISNALKKLQSVATNLTVSRATLSTSKPAISPRTSQSIQDPIESTKDSDDDNDENECNEDSDNAADDDKSVSSFPSESNDDSDDEVEYTPATKKAKAHSKATKVASEGDVAGDFTVYKMKSPPTFLCLKCRTRFPSFDILKAHTNGDNDCTRASLTCEICNKLCSSRKTLHSHVKSHDQRASFVCDQCGKVYTNQFNLENHKSSQHGEYVAENGLTYRCQLCEAKFNNRTDLYAHIAEHGRQPVVVVCEKCGKSFKSKKALQTHMRQHLDIRPHACTYCPKRFSKRLSLIQHVHIHTGIKTFKCDLCEKAFAKRDSLIVHKRKHTGEMPYECTQCPEKYTSLNLLKSHLKSHTTNQCGEAESIDAGQSDYRIHK